MITTPNASYIPYFDSEVINLHPFGNGKYGRQDYTIHPQLYFDQYPWVPCITRRPSSEDQFMKHRLFHLWTDQHLHDWDVLPVHAFHARGTMQKDRWEVLARVVHAIEAVAEPLAVLQPPPNFATTRTAMLASLQRLRHLPMTKRDFVLQKAQCQRLALDVDAMSTFLQRFHASNTTIRASVDEDLMGCFTTNPAVVDKMLHRGIPVWFVRDPEDAPPGTIKVVRIASRFSQSPSIQEWEYLDYTLPEPDQVTHPFASVALVGHEVQRVTLLRTMGRHFTDLVRLPTGPAEVILADQQDLTDPSNSYGAGFPSSASTPMQQSSSVRTPIPGRTPSPIGFDDFSPASPSAHASMALPSSAPTPIPHRSPSPMAFPPPSSRQVPNARQPPQGITKKKPKTKRGATYSEHTIIFSQGTS